jgi:hypothetical protein
MISKTPEAVRQTVTDMPAVGWEYKVVRVGPSGSLVSEAMLDEHGADGWELVAFQPMDQRAYPGEGTFYFKRPRRGGVQ